ncbi:MAG: hypothetical protein HQL23_07985 [Candidatus Omnitrophica bacterium]|nr:hypothetical protein [Candidatus Omnitrophota bacterium]
MDMGIFIIFVLAVGGCCAFVVMIIIGQEKEIACLTQEVNRLSRATAAPAAGQISTQELSDAQREKEADLRDAGLKFKEAREETARLRAELTGQIDKDNALSAQVKQLSDQAALLQKENAGLTEKLAGASVSASQEEAWSKLIAEKDQSLKEKDLVLKSAEENNKAAQEETARLRQELAAQLEKINSQTADAEKGLEEKEEALRQKDQELVAAQARLKDQTAKTQQKTEEIQALEKKIQDLRANVEQLEAAQKNSENAERESETLKTEMSEAKKTLEAALQEKDNLNRKWESDIAAVESALNGQVMAAAETRRRLEEQRGKLRWIEVKTKENFALLG